MSDTPTGTSRDEALAILAETILAAGLIVIEPIPSDDKAATIRVPNGAAFITLYDVDPEWLSHIQSVKPIGDD